MTKSFQKTIPVRFPKHGLATVERSITLTQIGRAKFKNAYWNAQFESVGQEFTANPGELVVVTGRQGLTLLVAPLDTNSCVTPVFP